MDWLQGIPEVVAVVLGTAAAVAAALWAAPHVPLHRFFAWLVPPAEQGPAIDIDRLVALADLARREGILSLEARVHGSGDPFLESGVAMLVDGASQGRLRQQLEGMLDREISVETRSRGGRWTRVAHVFVLAATTFGLVAAWRAGTTGPALGPCLAAFLASYASLLGLAFVGPVCDRAFAVAGAGKALIGMMTVETLTLIAQRAEGSAVRARLTELLPPSARAGLARAAA